VSWYRFARSWPLTKIKTMASADTIEDETLRDEDVEAALSGCLSTLTMASDSGTVTVVDAKEQMKSIISPNTVRPALGKVAKIFKVSDRFSEVNQEQIDRIRMSK